MHLQQDVDRTSGAIGLAVDLDGEPLRVHAMDQMHEGGDLLDLVPLQAADRVPSDVVREALRLADQFLHPVLAEVALPGLVEAPDRCIRLRLGDRDQRRAGGVQLALQFRYFRRD